jgi:hypothetical protein
MSWTSFGLEFLFQVGKARCSISVLQHISNLVRKKDKALFGVMRICTFSYIPKNNVDFIVDLRLRPPNKITVLGKFFFLLELFLDLFESKWLYEYKI